MAGEHVGRSILEILWEALDLKMEQLGEADAAEEGWDHAGWEQYGMLRGKAAGLAYAIAVLQNPYEPNIDAVRNEAVERYDRAGD